MGTYKGDQLTHWNGWYNYPVSDDDFNAETQRRREGRHTDLLTPDGVRSEQIRLLESVTELWLFRGAKEQKTFKAEFVGIKTREELIRNYGYPAKGRAHGEKYLLFRTEFLYLNPSDFTDSTVERVLVRTADFAKRSPRIAKQLKAFLESADRDNADLAKRLPSILTRLAPEKLCVYEEAVQMEFKFMNDIWFSQTSQRTLSDYSFMEELISDAPNIDRIFTHVDCFSGVGGFCTGLHAVGFTTKVAIEKVKSCVDTYKVNHPEVHVINSDITKVKAEDILPYCPKAGIDLVTSGMPCETFSTAGNTSRSFYDDRQFLFREGIRIAQITNAKYLLFENVPGIMSKLSSKGGKTLIIDILKEEMAIAGYGNFIEVILDATKFGVPQNRKRYFVLGTRFPQKHLHSPLARISHIFSVGNALEGLPPVVPNSWIDGREYQSTCGEYANLMRNEQFWRRGAGQTSTISYHMPMKHRAATLERFSRLRTGESLRDLFARYNDTEVKELQLRHVLPNKIFIKRNYRLPLGVPSPTVTSHCLDEFVHPTENRALTVRECARLQSFPDSYDFKGGPYIVPHINRDVQDKYEQIGDAVPPLLAYAWGKVILRMLMED